ncbi:MAG: hypothetical protein GY851_06365, partial [bacterium]|nr:hypothetical protein [bacterium]
MRVYDYLLTGVVVAFAACLPVAPAGAQLVPVVVVDPVPDLSNQQFDDLEAAVDHAKTLSQANPGEKITVLVNEGTWSVSSPIGLGLDTYVEIVGRGTTSINGLRIDGPSKVVIVGPGPSGHVFDITSPEYPVLIKGVTIQGGDVGVRATDTATGTQPVILNRCYVRGNGASGVECATNAKFLIANCIFRDNGGDGVRLIDDSYAAVQFCTIFGHASGAGVSTQDSSSCDVRNCLVFDNATGLQETAGTVNWAYNNVGGNITNLDSVGAGAANQSIDPLLIANSYLIEEDPPADRGRGKLRQYEDAGNRLIGRADPNFLTWTSAVLPDVAMADYLFVDIEGDKRPGRTTLIELAETPDIGVDEELAGAPDISWQYVEVRPPDPDAYILEDPLDPETPRFAAIGRLQEGELLVEVRLSSGEPDAVFLLPQGGDIADPTHRIQLRTLGSAEGYWLGTNDEDIEREMGTAGTVITTDGHAAVYVDVDPDLVGEDIIGADPAVPGRMSEQVRTYRHALIDTIPPRLRLLPASASPLSAPPLVSLLNLVADGYQGTYGATLTGGIHPPGLPVFPTGWRPAAYRNAPQFPFDDGLITGTSGTSKGAQAFFNVASLSNVFPNEALNIQILAEFIDAAPANTGVDRFTNSTAARASGFPPGDNSYPTAEDIAAGLEGYETGPGQWKFGANAGLPADVDVLYTTEAATTVEGEGGYDFGNLTEDQTGAGLAVVAPLTTATWTFDTFGTPGIVRTGGEDHLHMAIRFVPKDRAGNQAQIEVILDEDETLNPADLALDPLHLWWTDEARTQILPKLEGQDVLVNRALFRYQLRRSYDPAPAGADVRPLYSHRIWWNPTPGSSVTEYNGTYSPVTGWFDWNTTGLITENEFSGLEGHWVLMVTAGADEAGNVEQWPADLILGAGDIIVGFTASTGSNWQRVYIQNPESELDTIASARFQHDINGRMTTVGSGNLAPVPT